MLGINLHAFTILSLDQYGHVRSNCLFCKFCFQYIKELKSSKFGTTNIINVCACQDYSDILKELMLVEEVVIACIHLIILIPKLKLSSASLLVLYHQIHGHVVILPQNPGLLLDLLLSNALLLDKIIKVVWASKWPHTAANILLFG